MNVVFTSLKVFLDNILGTYTPIVFSDSNGIDIIPNGFSGLDIPYIIRAITFLIVVYSLFRILGVIMSKRW